MTKEIKGFSNKIQAKLLFKEDVNKKEILPYSELMILVKEINITLTKII